MSVTITHQILKGGLVSSITVTFKSGEDTKGGGSGSSSKGSPPKDQPTTYGQGR
jgi:hypothetical protein